jgi:hypothetical protein
MKYILLLIALLFLIFGAFCQIRQKPPQPKRDSLLGAPAMLSDTLHNIYITGDSNRLWRVNFYKTIQGYNKIDSLAWDTSQITSRYISTLFITIAGDTMQAIKNLWYDYMRLSIRYQKAAEVIELIPASGRAMTAKEKAAYLKARALYMKDIKQ